MANVFNGTAGGNLNGNGVFGNTINNSGGGVN